MSNFFNWNLKDLVGAAVSAVLVAVLGYLANISSLADVNFSQVLGLAVAAFSASMLKSLLTTEEGKFLGAVKVK